MIADIPLFTDRTRLYRKALNSYWMMFILALVGEWIGAMLYSGRGGTLDWAYFAGRIILPTVIQLLVIGFNEYLYSRFLMRPEWIVLSGTVIAASLMQANPTVHLMYVLVLPILISLFFFKKRLLYLAFAANLAAFFAIYTFSAPFKTAMNVYDICAFFIIMIGILYIALQVIVRGKQMIADFMRMVTTEQDLLVRNAVMDRLAKIDALTELYNHKTVHEYLDQLIEQSNNNMMPLQLAILDIDNFKNVNDTYGHAVGDVVLVRVAKAIKDSLSENEIIARYGGEEFVVIFPGKTLFEAFQAMEQTREHIREITHPEMGGKRISVSIGLAEHSFGTCSSTLFDEADEGLYYAKKHGKNQTTVQQAVREASGSSV